MNVFKIELDIISLETLTRTIRQYLAESANEQPSYHRANELYILKQALDKMYSKQSAMNRSMKTEGKVKLNQIEVDVLSTCIEPSSKVDGRLLGEVLKYTSHNAIYGISKSPKPLERLPPIQLQQGQDS